MAPRLLLADSSQITDCTPRKRSREFRVDALLRRKGAAGFVIAGLLTSLLGYFSWRNARQTAADADAVTYSHAVMETLEVTLRHLLDVDSSGRGFALTGHEPFLETYGTGKLAVVQDLDALRHSRPDNSSGQRRLDVMASQVTAQIEYAASLVAARRQTGATPTVRQLEQAQQLMDAVRTTIQQMHSEEVQLLEQRIHKSRAAQRSTILVMLTGSLLDLAFLIMAGFAMNRSARARAEVNALNAELELRVAQRTASLGESENRLAGVIQSAMDSIITVDAQRRIVLFNAAAERMFRCPAADVLGQPIERFIPQRFHAAHSGHIQRFGENGVTTRAMGAMGALWATRADGEEFQIEASISQIEAAGQKMFTVILRDVTERVQVERDLRETQARMTGIIASAMDAIITIDRQQRIVLFNTAAEKMFGCPAAEALGDPLARFIPERFRAAHGGHIRRFEETGTTNRAMGAMGALWALRADGQEFQIEASISQIEAAGKRLFTVILRDVSEAKRAEEALREQSRLLDLAPVLGRDMESRIVLWNAGAEKLFGYSREEALNQISYELLQTEFSQPIWQIEAQLLRSGTWEGELIHLRKDSSILAVTSVWVLHRNAQGQPLRVLETNTDITARRRAEMQLALQAKELSRQAQELTASEQQIRQLNDDLEQRVQQRTAELEAANKDLEGFTYSVSHDLRAPLRHIAGFSGMLLEEYASKLEPEAQRYLQRIQDGTRRMGMLVDDLLNLARIGRQQLHRQLTGLDSVVNDVIADLQPDAVGRTVEWKVGSLPYLEADPSLLKQVFQNLLSNALKYSRPRSSAVIEIGQVQPNGTPVVFVRDNGVGFSMKYRDKLFGVFQRLHREEDFEGTGVGLAVVQRIVQKHGGNIWAEAEVDKGATFYFTLGAVGAAEPEAQAITAGGQS
ncbi:MAG: PAS domain S-box protein [Terriglobales bacterium]